MKNYKTLILILTTLLVFGGCAQKKASSKKTSSSSSSGVGSGNGGISEEYDPSPGESTASCSDGVARAGATKCYYTNLDTFVFNGPGTRGPVYWSSANNLPSHISPNQFRTDASFAVRIKPLIADATTSFQGRKCSQFTKNNFSKLKVEVMLRRASDSLGEVKTLAGSVNGKSNTVRFTVPGGTTEPYVLEIVSVLSNHRCSSVYGSAPTGCSGSSPYYDIPVVSSTANPTECVAFNLEYATDDTYDLPN